MTAPARLVRWAPPSLRVIVAGPHPGRRGGVSSLVDTVRDHARDAEITWLPVGRRSRLDLAAPMRDLAAVRRLRKTHDLLHLDPSLRWRALLRDLALLGQWGGPAVLWFHGWDVHLAEALEAQPTARVAFAGAFRRARCAVLAPIFRDGLVRLGVPAEQIDVVPPAWSGAPLAREEVPGEVLFLGRLTRDKGVLELIEAVARLDGVRLVLAGEGPLAGVARAKAAALGVDVRLPGWLTGEAKWQALARASIVALPSFGEGVPVGLLEAMAAGAPVVATRVGGVPWLLQEGRAGALVDRPDPAALADALADLLGDPARRERLADRGRLRAASFRADAVVGALERVWARAVATP